MKVRPLLFGLTLGGLTMALLVGDAFARIQVSDPTALALDRVLSPAVQPLYVSSVAAQPGRPFADAYTAFGKNVSPPVSWNGAPPETKTYVVIMEDSDAHGGTPTVHWLAYNIPATAKGLAKNIHNRGEPKSPAGTMQGVNYLGGVGYVGPNPPESEPPHHYHIEVFAMDRVLDVKPYLNVDQLVAAMNERVLADGETVGTFAAPPPKAADKQPQSK